MKHLILLFFVGRLIWYYLNKPCDKFDGRYVHIDHGLDNQLSRRYENHVQKPIRHLMNSLHFAAARPGDRSGGGSPSLARAGSEDVREVCNQQTMPAFGGSKAGVSYACLFGKNPDLPRIRVWSSASTLEKMNYQIS